MDANPDVEWYWIGNSITTSLYVAKALREHAKELGMPDAKAPKVISNMWGMDERAWEMCGADCVGNTFVMMSFAAFGDLTVPGMEKVVALHDKYRKIDSDPIDEVRQRPLRAGLRQLLHLPAARSSGHRRAARRSTATTSRTPSRPSAASRPAA